MKLGSVSVMEKNVNQLHHHLNQLLQLCIPSGKQVHQSPPKVLVFRENVILKCTVDLFKIIRTDAESALSTASSSLKQNCQVWFNCINLALWLALLCKRSQTHQHGITCHFVI